MHFTRLKTALILAVLFVGLLLAAPNLLPPETRASLPSWVPSRSVTLGLDLQGGSHLLLEVDAPAVVKGQAETLLGDIRRVLRDEKIGFVNLRVQGRSASVSVRDPGDAPRAFIELQKLMTPVDSALFDTGADRTVEISQPSPGNFVLTLTEAGTRARMTKVLDRSIEIVRRRVDELGTTEPLIQRQGANRILVQLPGLKDPSRFKTIIGETGQLEFRMVDLSISPEQAEQTGPPPDSELVPSKDGSERKYVLEKRVIVSGEDLIDAQATFDQGNQPVVSFRFNTNGARRFGQATSENVGRPFAIVLDKHVISAPVINEPITGGSGQISGNFTTQSANDLALLLRSGALPAPLTIVEERTVGPGLGQDSIRAGQMAALVGSALVILFMIATYGLFGIFASIAVALNVGLIFGILSLIGATLTLPGIAGIVLTVGIAVDSNVLIYERIREEVRAGRSPIASLNAGFDRALATILDSNITTFIAAAVLFFVGTGAVRGFAVTLGIGIITTVFTAFTVTRLITAWWFRAVRPAAIPI